MAFGGGGQPPSTEGSHIGLQSAPQGIPWQGSIGHEGAPDAHSPSALHAKGPAGGIGIRGGVQVAPHFIPWQGSASAHAGGDAVQVTLPSQTPGVGAPQSIGPGQGSTEQGAPQALP